VEKISKKLKTFQHTEFNNNSYTSIPIIKKKISNLEDLFGRNQKYIKTEINEGLPEYIRNNLGIFKDYIL